MTDAKADYRDIAHPLTRQFREYLQRRILEACKKEVATRKHLGSLAEEMTSEIGEYPPEKFGNILGDPGMFVFSRGR